MNALVVLSFLFLALITLPVVNTQNITWVDVQERCSSCNDVDCEPTQLALNSCQPFCSACSALCKNYYLLQPYNNPNDDKPEYVLGEYTDENCTTLIYDGFQVMVACDSCYSDNDFACSRYYLDCGVDGSWFYFFFGVFMLFFVVVVVAGAIAAYIYYDRKRKYDKIDDNDSYHEPSFPTPIPSNSGPQNNDL